MKKIVLLGLLLNCSLTVYANENPLVPYANGYTATVKKTLNSEEAKLPQLKVVIGPVYCEELQDNVLANFYTLGVQVSELIPTNKDKVVLQSCRFLAPKCFLNEIKQKEPFHIFLTNQDLTNKKAAFAVLTVERTLDPVIVTEHERANQITSVTHLPEKNVELTPSHDSAPKIKIYTRTAVMVGIAGVLAMFLMYNIDYLPPAFSQILSNMQAKLAGIVSFSLSRRF